MDLSFLASVEHSAPYAAHTEHFVNTGPIRVRVRVRALREHRSDSCSIDRGQTHVASGEGRRQQWLECRSD